jgi:hypothetical protein
MGAGVAQVGQLAGRLIQGHALGQMTHDQNVEARAQQSRAVSAANDPREIQQLDQMIKLNNDDINRRKAIIASADPAMIELGNQTLAMLRGQKETGTNAGMRNQFAQQRAQLENKLRSQLGSGYATSSAGIQALSQFDQGVSNSLAQNNQGTLNSYLPIVAGISQRGQQQGIENSQTIGNMFGNIAARNVKALNGQAASIVSSSGASSIPTYALGSALGSASGGASGYFAQQQGKQNAV